MGNREKFESWLGVTDWLNLLTLARGRDHQPQENERMHFWAGPIGALFMVRQAVAEARQPRPEVAGSRAFPGARSATVTASRITTRALSPAVL